MRMQILKNRKIVLKLSFTNNINVIHKLADLDFYEIRNVLPLELI